MFLPSLEESSFVSEVDSECPNHSRARYGEELTKVSPHFTVHEGSKTWCRTPNFKPDPCSPVASPASFLTSAKLSQWPFMP